MVARVCREKCAEQCREKYTEKGSSIVSAEKQYAEGWQIVVVDAEKTKVC